MNKHNSVPNIRFNGFEDKWKKSELKEIAKIVGGGTPDTNNANYWNGNINWYSPNEIGKYPYVYSSHKKITNLGFKKSSAKLHPSEKTILFTSRAGIGDMAILKTEAATNQGFQSLELKNNINPYFVYSYGFKIKREAYKLASGSTFLEISKKDMEKINLWLPTKNEQQKIGDFFTKLDKLLDLQQKKIDKLELLKKALLQKLFPRHDTKIPELRFKGFERDWNQDKAINIFKNVSDKNHPELPVLSASQEDGMVLRKDINIDIKFKNSSLTTYKKVEPGQFVIHLRSFQGGFAYSTFEGITSPAYTILAFIKKENHYKLFWKQIFLSGNFIRRLKTITYGVRDGKSISYNDFGSLNICFPFIKEQQKIGNLLSKVDQLIELENKKLQNFQQLKKCLLQNLFVE